MNTPNPKIQRIDNPSSHFLVSSSKKIHGWFNWERRECTSERFLLNPYNGCGIGCFYCYTRALPGYFQRFQGKGEIFVFKDFDKQVSKQIDSLDIGFCGYLSPVTDPFQPLEKACNLSVKTIKAFIDRGLPVEFITKAVVPDEVFPLLACQEHSFGQVSIITEDVKLNRVLHPKAASPDLLFGNIKKLSRYGIYSVCRVDPILPFLTDSKESLRRLVIKAKECGARHIIASVADIPPKLKGYFLSKIKNLFGLDVMRKYINLYTDRIGYLHAKASYRKEIFSFLREEVFNAGMTFSLCMEYEKRGDEITGLNREFSTSENCEGINVPIYKRKGNRFYPQKGCKGNCLNCRTPLCGIDELAYAQTGNPLSLKYSDYRRFSKSQKTEGDFLVDNVK